MNFYLRFRSVLALALGCVLLSIVPSSFAQAQDGAGRGGRGGRGGLANMTDEQREALRQMGQETRDLNTKLTEARTALNDAIYADKVDEDKIRQESAAVAKIEADLAVARAKAFDKVRTKFTPEQIAALKRTGGFFGGGRGGRGGRGGGAGGAGGAGGNNN